MSTTVYQRFRISGMSKRILNLETSKRTVGLSINSAINADFDTDHDKPCLIQTELMFMETVSYSRKPHKSYCKCPRVTRSTESKGGFVASSSASIKNIAEKLSHRELDVFIRIGRAQGTAEIAKELGLSVKTIESHQDHIKRKIYAKTGRELVRMAVLWVDAFANTRNSHVVP